jgi:hypothetical protein
VYYFGFILFISPDLKTRKYIIGKLTITPKSRPISSFHAEPGKKRSKIELKKAKKSIHMILDTGRITQKTISNFRIFFRLIFMGSIISNKVLMTR